jgi:hypothetical protein
MDTAISAALHRLDCPSRKDRPTLAETTYGAYNYFHPHFDSTILPISQSPVLLRTDRCHCGSRSCHRTPRTDNPENPPRPYRTANICTRTLSPTTSLHHHYRYLISQRTPTSRTPVYPQIDIATAFRNAYTFANITYTTRH